MSLAEVNAMLTGGIQRIPGDFKRDSRGTPYVSDPDGGSVKSGPRKGESRWVRYGRPSGFGKEIENTYNLQRWSERQIVVGMLVEDQELTDRLLAAAELDSETDKGKEALDAIVVHSKRLAKTHLAAERGTHMHAVTEDDDSDRDWLSRIQHGQSLGLPHEVQEAMLSAWQQTIERAGLVTTAIEQAVVHDGWRQAGTLDRVATLGHDLTFGEVTIPAGTSIVLDVKTGRLRTTAKGVIEYWHSYAIQCATYAGSVPYDVDTDARETWAFDIDQRWALIAHLPVDEALQGVARCRLILVDIAAAREAVESVILPARAWQARTDLFAVHDTCVEVPVAGAPAARDDCLLRMWLTKRLAQVAEVPDAVALMVTWWPEGVPGLKSDHVHSEAELERISDVLTRVEAQFQVPFEPDPRRPAPPAPPVPRGAWEAPDEGEILGMDHEDVAGLRKRVAALSPAEQSIAEMWMLEAVRAGRGFSIGQLPSRRRWLIYRVALDLATTFEGDADIARATLALAIPAADQLAVPIGSILGSLSLDEARHLADELIPALVNGKRPLIFDGDVPRWGETAA